jgi:hypothetical protein
MVFVLILSSCNPKNPNSDKQDGGQQRQIDKLKRELEEMKQNLN